MTSTAQPLVSVIVPTLNSAGTLAACLLSVREQDYPSIELIVVDNHSRDDTLAIAKQYADRVFTKGPERSAQRNFGVQQSRGRFVLIIDSDMELTRSVISQCVAAADTAVAGVIIPEESFGKGFWAAAKKLERSFYIGVDFMEAARFYRRAVYDRLGGFDRRLVSGEDWDLSQRAARLGKIARVAALIRHNEGRINLVRTIKKKYYYARHFAKYLQKNRGSASARQQTGVLARYKLYFSQPRRLWRHPLLGLGMLFMKTAEFAAGGLGLLLTHNKS